MKFKHDYVDFEDGELVRVRCMSCGNTVAQMEEYPSVKHPDKLVRKMRKYSMWRQKRVDLTDDSYADIILCTDCFLREDPCEGVNADNLTEQMREAWYKESLEVGRDTSDRDAIFKRSRNVRVLSNREKEIINARNLQ